MILFQRTSTLLDILLPRKCLVCGRKLLRSERHVCIYCLADLPGTFYIRQRHNPMADRFNGMIIRGEDPFGKGYAFAGALFFYRKPWSEITKALKYRRDIPAGRFFAKLLGEELAASALFRDVDAVVPVPLHPWRRFSRGYNQAGIIASQVAGCLGAEYVGGALRRRRMTRSQTSLSIEEKARNVSGAFAVNARECRKLLTARHILIVDDVFTTGATVCECYRALSLFLFENGLTGTRVRISVATLASV